MENADDDDQSYTLDNNEESTSHVNKRNRGQRNRSVKVSDLRQNDSARMTTRNKVDEDKQQNEESKNKEKVENQYFHQKLSAGKLMQIGNMVQKPKKEKRSQYVGANLITLITMIMHHQKKDLGLKLYGTETLTKQVDLNNRQGIMQLL